MNWFFQTKAGKMLAHVLAWLGVTSLPFVLRELFFAGAAVPTIFAEPIEGDNWIIVLAFQGLLIAFFYLNAWVLVPRCLHKRRFGLYFLSVGLCLALIVSAIRSLVESGWIPEGSIFQERRYFGMVAAFLIFWLASLGYRMTVAWFQSEQARRDLENEKLKTELSFLHGQINPHFLFNTLNTIYTLAHQKSERTPGAVLQLSNLLRYVLDTHTELAPLEEEIRHMQDFIALHRLRLTPKTQVEWTLRGEPLGCQIAPMLLLPFVENAFKHGVSSHRESSLVFQLDIEGKTLHFRVENQRLPAPATLEQRSGIGIQNVRRRLELLYPGRHTLQLDTPEDRFLVLLTLQLA
ncbi:MAG: histidine kinase [Saprospiraceae bacterium]|nr:histidine kinase [Saprospiraceae bacterium]